MDFTPIPLTAAQINTFDEINFDAASAEEGLKLAMNFFTNRITELNKKRTSAWKELGAIHGIDFTASPHFTGTFRGQVCIIKGTPEDKQ